MKLGHLHVRNWEFWQKLSLNPCTRKLSAKAPPLSDLCGHTHVKHWRRRYVKITSDTNPKTGTTAACYLTHPIQSRQILQSTYRICPRRIILDTVHKARHDFSDSTGALYDPGEYLCQLGGLSLALGDNLWIWHIVTRLCCFKPHQPCGGFGGSHACLNWVHSIFSRCRADGGVTH